MSIFDAILEENEVMYYIFISGFVNSNVFHLKSVLDSSTHSKREKYATSYEPGLNF